jgi:hypothetical protein
MHGSHLRVETISVCVKRFGDFHCTTHHMPVLFLLYITGEVRTYLWTVLSAQILYAMVVDHT